MAPLFQHNRAACACLLLLIWSVSSAACRPIPDTAVVGTSGTELRGLGARLYAGASVNPSGVPAFLNALANNSVTDISLQGLVRLTRDSLASFPGQSIALRGARTVTIRSVNPAEPAILDFGRQVNAVNVGAGVEVMFQDMVTQGFASPYQPEAAQLDRQIVGLGSWPTITAEPGAAIDGYGVTGYSLQADCSTFATSAYALARKRLGNDSVVVLGPSTLYVKGYHELPLPIIDRKSNITVGTVVARINNTVSICQTDDLAAAVANIDDGGSGTHWWVWLLVALAAAFVVLSAATAGFLLWRRRRRQRQQTSANSLPAALPDGDGKARAEAASAEGGSAADRVPALASLALKRTASLGRTDTGTTDSSAAETALIDAWRNRQLSSGDAGTDAVELGPMIGRGGFGRVHKARWRGAIVACKIVNHRRGGEQMKDIRVLRETLFSTSLLHPNIVVTYKIITLANPIGTGSVSGSKQDSRTSTATATVSHASQASSQEDRTHITSRMEQFASAAASARASADIGSRPLADPDDPAVGGDFTRALSVRIDDEAVVEDELLDKGGLESLAETLMLMEYCDRGSLDKAMQSGLLRQKSDDQVDMVKVYRCLIDIASGMAYLHDAGILHGDLKLGNILLKSTTTDIRGFICKICDFGMSRLMDNTKSHVSTSSFGTISYMPPELLCGGGLSKKGDVYSMGMIMWELLTSEVAFNGINMGHLIFTIVHKQERPAIPWDCPEPFKDLMTACWQHDAADRPSFSEVLAQLEAQYADLRSQLPSTSLAGRVHSNIVYQTVEIASSDVLPRP